MNIPFISRGGVAFGCMLFAFLATKGQAENYAVVKLSATVLPGVCTVQFEKPDIELPAVSTRKITQAAANTDLTGGNEGINNLSVNCTGPVSSAPAKLTLRSNDGVSINGVTSWFRNVSGSSENTALAVRVRYRQVGKTDGWSDYLAPDDSKGASMTAINMDKQSIPFQFSMWCAPGGSQTYINCGLPGGGTVKASMNVSVDYP
ncbi:hypothetical protein [Enterobacter asburiae]|uniref:hypothetical protein n=1 Tax=Enterobacter asburiae TaxID=61645 RepID=UPI0021CEEF3C|nr:hypothetical protein [Enterobacter asburiae]MCU6244083.1 hypothetical protein [Enterobacter asburiae]